MEKKNNMVIWLLLVIIAILVVLCVLFATNKITINSSNNSNKNTLNDTNNNNDNTNVNNKLNNSEAEAVVKNLFTNETVRWVYDNSQVTNCKRDDSKTYTEKELGLDYTWGGYYKATDFSTYKDYLNNIKQYFTDEYYKKEIEDTGKIKQKIEQPDGTILYYYYEKDGALYCANTNKGGNGVKASIKEAEYNITNITSDEIDASVDASWYGFNYSEGAQEKINIKIVKENDSWKISSYEVQ